MTDRLDALCVEENNGKSYFTKIGVAFANRNGGYTVKLRAMPAPTEGEFKILLMEPKQDAGGGRGQRADTRQPAPAYDDDVPGF